MSEQSVGATDRRRGPRILALGLVVATLVGGCDALAGPPGPAGGAGSSQVPGVPAAIGTATDRAAAPPTPAVTTPAVKTPAVKTAPATSASPAATATPTLPPTPSPASSPGPFAMDLYRPGDFVTETSKVMCVAAAMQVMVNVMAPSDDRTAATQDRLYALARSLSPPTLKGDGAEPEGWARGLEQLGYGAYEVVALKTMAGAVKAAAKAIRLTGRPAGLLVWYGAHSWVMSGFRATADPALTDRFTVTAVSIEDVWYPKVSTLWGRSRPPDALVPVSKLPRDFLPWRMPGGPYPDKAWKYVIVVPVA